MSGQWYSQDFEPGILGSNAGPLCTLVFFLSKGVMCSLKAGMLRRVFGKSGNELEHKVWQVSHLACATGVP